MKRKDGQPSPDAAVSGARHVGCDDVQELLFAYVARELGPARAAVVRGHLKDCAECRARAAEIRATLDLLKHAAPTEGAAPEHLSQERREHVFWAAAHPVREWIRQNHLAVSLVVAVLVVMVLASYVYRYQFQREDEPVQAIPVRIGLGPPPAAQDGSSGAGRAPTEKPE